MDRPAPVSQQPGIADPAGDDRLDAWIARHGPLSPRAALAIALHLCSRASAMRDAELAASVASLDTAAIARDADGRWQWAPRETMRSGRHVPDSEIVERIGAVIFECVTGQPLHSRFPDAAAVRAHARTLRPDVPSTITDLVATVASARGDRAMTLDRLAAELHRALRTTDPTPDRRGRRVRRALVGVLVTAGAMAVAWVIATGGEQIGPLGLTEYETVMHDSAVENAHYLAVTNEHTLSLQALQDVERLWRTRVASDDPRIALNQLQQAWVRLLRGDPLTAEQLLAALPSYFSRELGDHHPVTQVARERLAEVLEKRGSTREASAHRDEARRAMAELMADLGSASQPGTTPTPFGVAAHLAPNAPEREGFRPTADGGHLALVTSTQRMFAGRDGWQLVVRAAGECAASIDVGRDVRRVGVRVTGAPASGWHVSIPGTRPELSFGLPSSPHASVLLTATGDATIRARTADGQEGTGTPDTTVPGPDPPYALRFKGATPDACQLVWWESRER